MGTAFQATVGNAPVLNIILENNARTFNRWGDVTERSHLFVVLNRRRLNPGTLNIADSEKLSVLSITIYLLFVHGDPHERFILFNITCKKYSWVFSY